MGGSEERSCGTRIEVNLPKTIVYVLTHRSSDGIRILVPTYRLVSRAWERVPPFWGVVSIVLVEIHPGNLIIGRNVPTMFLHMDIPPVPVVLRGAVKEKLLNTVLVHVGYVVAGIRVENCPDGRVKVSWSSGNSGLNPVMNFHDGVESQGNVFVVGKPPNGVLMG